MFEEANTDNSNDVVRQIGHHDQSSDEVRSNLMSAVGGTSR